MDVVHLTKGAQKMAVGNYDISKVDSWSGEQIIRYNVDFLMVLGELDAASEAFTQVAEHVRTSLISVWNRGTVDYGNMVVALVAHKTTLKGDIDKETLVLLKIYGFIDDENYFYSWALHS